MNGRSPDTGPHRRQPVSAPPRLPSGSRCGSVPSGELDHTGWLSEARDSAHRDHRGRARRGRRGGQPGGGRYRAAEPFAAGVCPRARYPRSVQPRSAAVDQHKRAVWVNCIARISERTQRVVARIHKGAGGIVAVDPHLGVVWEADSGGTMIEVSEATNKVIHRFTGLGPIVGVAVDPRYRPVWVSDNPFVREYSEVKFRLLHTIRLHVNRLEQPWDIRVDPTAGMVWAAVIPGGPQQTRTWVAQISESAHKVVHTYPYSNGTAITAPDPKRGIVWMAIGNGTGPGTIEVIKESTHHIVRTFTLPVSA